MSYQVLARKYRPRSFTQFVGQESSCRILKNALESQRIHHAYLFTGTRGIGKTSLARLLAKCLNCQQKITAEPCNQCSNCQAINANRLTDLIEVDAASRTKVEDTRDLLADVHYAPSQGRYKIYLIDEVHMLSSHSFNALLKTLEEPPPHVVFLLATTDPQRLPATILSRCLPFHLKALSVEQISQHLETILKNEQISYETSALHVIGQAARGSLRDALSLLDQAIAYANGPLTEQDIKTLLGHTPTTDIRALLVALINNNTTELWFLIEKLTAQANDFLHVIDELLTLLHDIAVVQVLPDKIMDENKAITPLANQLSKEDTQLYYQIALLSRRDIAWAPSPRLGFEMMLLRMLAFRPLNEDANHLSEKKALPSNPSLPEKSALTEGKKSDKSSENLMLDWISIVKKLNLTGITSTFAYQCVLEDYANNHVKLLLDPKQIALRTPKQEEKLTLALSDYFKKPITLTISLADSNVLTPARYEQEQKTQRLQQTTEILQNDPAVQTIIKTFDATLHAESIQFLDEN